MRDAREPRFLGDMPHGWVASDQIRSVLDLFAYEDESESSLVLARRRAHDLAARQGTRDPRSPDALGHAVLTARVGADGAIDVRVSGLRSFRAAG